MSSANSAQTAEQTPLPIRPCPSLQNGPHPRIKDIKLLLKVADLSCQGAIDFLGTVNAGLVVGEAVNHVFQWLYTPESTVPGTRSVTLIIRSMEGVAYTRGKDLDSDHKEIHFSADYISNIPAERKKNEILGVVCHEMVHCFQFDACESAPSGLIEGIADWVRLCSGLRPPHWKKRADGEWDAGYERTGFFLEYLEQRFGEGSVRRVNETMRNMKYEEESFWKDLFGHHVEKLWEDYCKELKETEAVDEIPAIEGESSEGRVGNLTQPELEKANDAEAGQGTVCARATSTGEATPVPHMLKVPPQNPT
ncbi:MAG: hypothetical protein M1840_000901 [Geoglossum simile]|nr:MAG: hypothetical protein M1840_000901 [Geoglossum simile]